MSDYQDGKNVLRKRPEPGRLINEEKVTETVELQKANSIDVNAIADAVVSALGNKIPFGNVLAGGTPRNLDDFDNSKTLERLADTMSVHGKGGESNFEEGLGTVKKTKKDNKGVQGTIDLLSNIDEGE